MSYSSLYPPRDKSEICASGLVKTGFHDLRNANSVALVLKF